MYEAILRTQVSQGDIFLSLPSVVLKQAGGELQPSITYALGMLLSHDCDYDKPKPGLVLVASIWPLADLASGTQEAARKGMLFNALRLDAHPNLFPEAYVDFRTITTLQRSIIENATAEGRRIASLDDATRLVLQRQIARFIGVNR